MVYPAMSANVVATLIDIVDGRSAQVVEWGCGSSTVLLSRFLADGGNWVAVEDDPVWARRVSDACGSHVRVLLRHSAADDYVNVLETSGVDLTIVDGKRRPECLAHARKITKAGGIIALHDAQREEYHQAVAGLGVKVHRVVGTEGDELWLMCV